MHKVDLLVEETSALRSTVKDLADRCELVETAEQAKVGRAIAQVRFLSQQRRYIQLKNKYPAL